MALEPRTADKVEELEVLTYDGLRLRVSSSSEEDWSPSRAQRARCGRPLYDFGICDTAKNLLRNVMDYLRPKLEAGTPVVVLEPSCAAVIRDELVNLSPEIPLRSASASKLFL